MSDYNSSSIVTMEGLSHLRRKSSMYTGGSGSVYGNYICCKEIIDNAIDESRVDVNKHYDIDIVFFMNSKQDYYQFLVIDRGRGIPVDKIVDSFGKMFTSGKYEGSSYTAALGVWGIGAKLTAALANTFMAFSKRNDGFGYSMFEQGANKASKILHKAIDKDQSTAGTMVFAEPDESILIATKEFIKHEDGFAKLIDLMEFYSVFNTNTTIKCHVVNGLINVDELKQMDPVKLWKHFQDIARDQSHHKSFVSDHLMSPRRYIQKKFGLKKHIWELTDIKKSIGGDLDPIGYDIDLFVDEVSAKGRNGYVAAVNMTPISTPSSTHIDMLQNVIKSQLVDYIDDDETRQYFETKYQIPVSGHILVFWKNVEYGGQDKSKFEDRRFGDLYRSALRKQFSKIPDSKWEVLYETIKEHLEQEYARYTKSAYKISKNLKGVGYTLNHIGSFYNCSSTDRSVTELFITEGDSAGGRVKAVRDDKTQAILKLRGKPFNAIRGDNKKLNANLIYQDMVRLIGVSPSDKDLSNMNFNKIVIMTDADADGCHIVALLVGTFYRINPLILEQGRVVITNPPLYSTLMKNQAIYLRDQDALEQSRVNCVYRTLLDIYIETNKDEYTLDDDQFMSFCYLVKKIGRVVTQVANVLNVEPMILEQLLHCVDYITSGSPDTVKIKNILGIDDVVYNRESDSIILIDSGLEIPVPLHRLQAEIRAFVLPEYKIGLWDKFNMFVTTKCSDLYVHAPVTYMMLYSIFETLDTCYSIRRFKGLGEMSEAAIYYTCVDPQTRCFSVVNGIGDVKKIYDMLGVDSTARKKLMDGGYIEEVAATAAE